MDNDWTLFTEYVINYWYISFSENPFINCYCCDPGWAKKTKNMEAYFEHVIQKYIYIIPFRPSYPLLTPHRSSKGDLQVISELRERGFSTKKILMISRLPIKNCIIVTSSRATFANTESFQVHYWSSWHNSHEFSELMTNILEEVRLEWLIRYRPEMTLLL